MQPLIAMLVPAVVAEGTGAATALPGQNSTDQAAASGFDALVAALTAAGNGVSLAADGSPVPASPDKHSTKPLLRPDQTAEGASMAALMAQMAGLQPVAETLPSADGELAVPVTPPVAAPAPTAPAAAPGAVEPDALSAPLAPLLADTATVTSAAPDDVSQTDLMPPSIPSADLAASTAQTTLAVAATGAPTSTEASGMASAIDMLRNARSKNSDTTRTSAATQAAVTSLDSKALTSVAVTAAEARAGGGEPMAGTDTGDAAMPFDSLNSTPDLSASAPVEASLDPASAQASPAGQTSVAAVREVAASSNLHSTRMVASTHLSPAAQLTGRIEQAVSEGQTTLTVRLDPESLGRVEVKLELQDGRVTASIAAERPATLDLLQRDARLLERAVQQSGLQLSDAGMQFSLREGAGQWAEAQSGNRRGGSAYGVAAVEPVVDPLSPAAVYQSDSLVDIQI
jgi:flagellar hook-length control protein FliK